MHWHKGVNGTGRDNSERRAWAGKNMETKGALKTLKSLFGDLII